MKKLMGKGKASGTGGTYGRLMGGNIRARKQADTAARAAANTPAHNAQASASVVPPSEEERKRRRSGTVLNPTDKLG
jgi:hypothetical protein